MRQSNGSWQPRPVDDIEVGAVVRIRPGERIPLDGLVQAGRSAVNKPCDWRKHSC